MCFATGFLFVLFLSYIAQWCKMSTQSFQLNVLKKSRPIVSWQIMGVEVRLPNWKVFYFTVLHSCLRIVILSSDKAQILKFSYLRSILDLFSSSDLLKQKWEIIEFILLSFPTLPVHAHPLLFLENCSS